MRARFVIDWDSTLVEDTYPDQGPWLPGAVSALRELSRHGDVIIFSCRVAGFEFPAARSPLHDVPRDPKMVALTIARMQVMLDDAGLGHIEIWQRPYKPNATVYIDDKAVRFTGDWDSTMEDVYEAIAPITTGTEIMLFREPGRTIMDDYVEARQREVEVSDFNPLDSMIMAGWQGAQGGTTRHPVARFFDTEELARVEALEALDDEPDMEQYGITEPPFPQNYEITEPPLVSTAERVEAVERVQRRWSEVSQDDKGYPTRHPNSQRFHDLLEEAGSLHDIKQADYGKGDDPFANVRSSADWGMPAWVGAMVRLNDKVKRLQKLAATGGLMNESAIDSFMDIAVYALIARVLYEQQGVAS